MRIKTNLSGGATCTYYQANCAWAGSQYKKQTSSGGWTCCGAFPDP